MTAQPPDPDPRTTPDLERGGGVSAGSTPPESAQTSGGTEPAPRPRHRYTPTQIVALIAVAVFVLVFAAAAVGLLLHIAG